MVANMVLCRLSLLGPPMLTDIYIYKTNCGIVFYNHANFYRFDKTSSYWSVKVVIMTNLGQRQKST